MKQEDFLKKIGIQSRYLTQYLNDSDVPRILETIQELEELRKQAEKEQIE